ncbi:MAG: glutamine synthetase III [Spirochaetales bacterium]|nr:glutamine synthetase III [Spirochaetales bacterium]
MSEHIDYSKNPLTEIYGENCFSDAVMKERLPANVYKRLKLTQEGSKALTIEIAEIVANSMKDWAIEKGATHYSHWFQPLTGLTAEKHDSFINPGPDGTVLLEFSGKELTQGEPDASSFPSGGLRATFEARGYTAWDTTSPAFIKDMKGVKTLTVPTAFVSYTGEALDKKVPLLRSMEAVNKGAMRILKALGNKTSKRVISEVGPEQEYFLVDESLYEKRPDLLLTGRTVFGTMSAKGQELDDHYFGAIKERVALFMHELNYELWRLGISAKTQHNEVAPNQFEIASVYSTSNLSTDSNQLVMEILKTVANRHGMVALLHEKPFAGVNGSGKHNNWSITTDDGLRLLHPGKSPEDNAQFLLFLTAVITAVDKYAPLLRLSAANSGNDHRLGANEAPPAIISIYLGDQLSEILDAIAEGRRYKKRDGQEMEIGVTTLPNFPIDMTDRNRTSPFAFTGNKFEFRMVGSSQSLAGPNVMLNTTIAEILSEFADRLEKAEDSLSEIKSIVKEYYSRHRRIVFNGNGYAEDWVKEAEKRGLPNLSCTVDALQELISDSCVTLFEKQQVLTKAELESRLEIYLETYSKQINIEAGVMVEMAKRLIAPAATRYMQEILDSVTAQKSLGIFAPGQEKLIKKLSLLINAVLGKSDELEIEITKALELENSVNEQAKVYRNFVVPAMEALREVGDALEKITDKSYWPYPSYEDMLFRL